MRLCDPQTSLIQIRYQPSRQEYLVSHGVRAKRRCGRYAQLRKRDTDTCSVARRAGLQCSMRVHTSVNLSLAAYQYAHRHAPAHQQSQALHLAHLAQGNTLWPALRRQAPVCGVSPPWPSLGFLAVDALAQAIKIGRIHRCCGSRVCPRQQQSA